MLPYEEDFSNVEGSQLINYIKNEYGQRGLIILSMINDGYSYEEISKKLKISNEAVATYAGIAVSEVAGVHAMAGGFSLGGKKNLTKGIKVDVGEKDAKIDVNIIVEYGARIPDVAFEIQTRVKKSVESMTGLKVLEVNVHVQGVHATTSKEEPEVLPEANNNEQ